MYNSRWTANLPKEDRDNFQELLNKNNKVLDRLKEICYNMLNESEKSIYDYDSASWAYKQAHANGFKQALEKIIELASDKGA